MNIDMTSAALNQRSISFQGTGVVQKFYAQSKGNMFKPLSQSAQELVGDFVSRVGKSGQFLNWVKLPEQQLARLDYFYEMASALKKQSANKPLTVLGIGGSKHTVENILSLMNVPERKVFTYSGIDNLSLDKFLNDKLNGDFRNSNYMVVSKSGTTFETADGYARIKNLIVDSYKNDGMTEKQAVEKANKHFIAVSDKSTKSALRVQAQNEKLLGEFFIHDDVGGRYSVFDDQGLFALAYAGVSKKDTVAMLKGAIEMTNQCSNPDIMKNPAMKKAVLYASSYIKGKEECVQQLFGDIFMPMVNWAKQLHLESLKDNKLLAGVVPESMHYAAESHYAPGGVAHFVLTSPKFPKEWYNPVKYLKGILNAYSRTGPTMLETIALNKANTKLSPKSVGAYCQMEHFATIYKGRMRDILRGNTERYDVYPEVLQPNVEFYKNEFKGGVLHVGG